MSFSHLLAELLALWKAILGADKCYSRPDPRHMSQKDAESMEKDGKSPESPIFIDTFQTKNRIFESGKPNSKQGSHLKEDTRQVP